MDVRSTRALITRLHNLIRDHDSHSNIIERFDELTKLLSFKLFIEEQGNSELLARRPRESDKGYASRLRTAYAAAADKRAEFIPAPFRTLRASDATISECASALTQVSFKNVGFDVKGLAYEEVIKNTFDKNDNQQFFTPPPIVEFMVQMMAPYLRGHICDPAAGTGGFLVQILKSGLPYDSLTDP